MIRCHQSFWYDFVANCSADVWVSTNSGKVEKDEVVSHYWKQEK